MLTQDQARGLIRECIATAEKDGEYELVIDDDAAQEHDFGWLFFVNSREFIESRDPMFMLVGAGPIFVERDGGRLIHTGSRCSLDCMLEAYRACGDPMARRSGSLLVALPSSLALDRLEVLKVVRKLSGATLAEAKSWLDELCVSQEAIRFGPSDQYDMDQAAQALTKLGLAVKPEWVPS